VANSKSVKRGTVPISTAENDLALAAHAAFERKKFRLAIELYRRAARVGEANWYSNVATIYDDYMRPPCPKKAVYYYKRAAREYAMGAYNLAIHYKQRGSFRWYKFWVQRAGEMGDVDALAEFKKLA